MFPSHDQPKRALCSLGDSLGLGVFYRFPVSFVPFFAD